MHFLRYFILASFVFLISCGESNKENTSHKSEPPKEEINISDYYFMEDLNDPEQWKEPRIQFLAKIDMQDFYGIWTSKIDGSDIRLVWSFKEFEEKHGESLTNYSAGRSPNNRYLTIALNADKGPGMALSRVLVDLKEKTWETMCVGGTPPSFTWTKDSKKVIFWCALKLKLYNLETKELTELPENIVGLSIYLLDDQETILAVGFEHYAYYKLNSGELIKKVEVKDIEGNIERSRLSENQQMLLLSSNYSFKLVNLKDDSDIFFAPKNKLPNGEEITLNYFVLPSNKPELVYEYAWIMKKLDFKTGDVTTLGAEMPFRTTNMSLINKSVLSNK